MFGRVSEPFRPDKHLSEGFGRSDGPKVLDKTTADVSARAGAGAGVRARAGAGVGGGA
jgi:hypothetical protein